MAMKTADRETVGNATVVVDPRREYKEKSLSKSVNSGQELKWLGLKDPWEMRLLRSDLKASGPHLDQSTERKSDIYVRCRRNPLWSEAAEEEQ